MDKCAPVAVKVFSLEDFNRECSSVVPYNAKYDEEFFKEKFLLLYCMFEPSGSNTLEITSVDEADNSIEFEITRYVPFVGTCDIAYWLCIAEIDRELSEKTVSITMVNDTNTSADKINASINKGSLSDDTIPAPKIFSSEEIGEYSFLFDTSKYDDVFFRDKFLYVSHLEDCSGSSAYEIASVFEIASTISVEVLRTKYGDTDDIVSWYLILEIDRALSSKDIWETLFYEPYFSYACSVRFADYDGTVLDNQNIAHGGTAIAPASPFRAGYTFIGWDKALNNVTYNLVITAVYLQNPPLVYTVTFEDYDGTVLDTQTIAAGEAATAPAEPSRDGYAFVGWDKGFENVTADLTVTAVYEENPLPPTVNIVTDGGITVSIDESTIEKMVAVTGCNPLTLEVIPTDNGFVIKLFADGKEVAYNDPKTPIKISVPVSENGTAAKINTADGRKYLPYSAVVDGELVILLAQTGEVTWEDNPIAYTDEIPDWATGHVGFVASRALFVGNEKNEYMPYVTLTLGQIVKVMAKLDLDDLSVYKDDERYGKDKWYSRPMMWAEDNGIVAAGSDPTMNTPREDVAVAFYNYILNKGVELSVKNEGVTFGDAAGISEAKLDAVTDIVAWGIMTGDGTNFNPAADITRAELAAVFSNLINAMLK